MSDVPADAAPEPLPVTVGMVRDRVAVVARYAKGDIKSPSRDAWAHAEEDSLHVDVLRAIADGCPAETAQALAAEALRTVDLRFSRWYE